MSFILDALKKSEAERSRQSGPTLIDMRIAPPRRGLPLWIIALTVILLANLVVLGIVLLRGSGTPSPQATPAPAPAPAPAPPPAVVSAPPAPEVAPAPANVLPPPTFDSGFTGGAPTEILPPVTRVPPPQERFPAPAAATAASDAALPSAEDLKLAGVGLPELRLALHVYDASPANRYVLLNSQRLREGDATSEGLVLERVTPQGAVLTWRAQRFRINAGE